jgi:hypothetical protein
MTELGRTTTVTAAVLLFFQVLVLLIRLNEEIGVLWKKHGFFFS